jgi:hypothetical protein
MLDAPALLAQEVYPESIPPTRIDADLGPCSALINVTDIISKPVYNAKVSVRIHYGFMGMKKLDLETFTSAAGQVQFVGLPEVSKKPLTFRVGKDEKTAIVIYDPKNSCQATLTALLN